MKGKGYGEWAIGKGRRRKDTTYIEDLGKKMFIELRIMLGRTEFMGKLRTDYGDKGKEIASGEKEQWKGGERKGLLWMRDDWGKERDMK